VKLVTIRSRRNWHDWIAVRARAREIRKRMNKREKIMQAREARTRDVLEVIQHGR
jgi:hypothetical protein